MIAQSRVESCRKFDSGVKSGGDNGQCPSLASSGDSLVCLAEMIAATRSRGPASSIANKIATYEAYYDAAWKAWKHHSWAKRAVAQTSSVNSGNGSAVLASQSARSRPRPAPARPCRKYVFWLEA